MNSNHSIDVEAAFAEFLKLDDATDTAVTDFCNAKGLNAAEAMCFIGWLAAKRSIPANTGTIDSNEFRKLAIAWSDAATECWLSKALDDWSALIAHIDARLNGKEKS